MDLAERKIAGEPMVWMGAILVATLLLALLLATTPPKLALMVGLGIGVFIIALANTQAALYILIFSMLLSPSINVAAAGGLAEGRAGIYIRLDDFLLMLLALGWLARTAIHKELGILVKTPLNRPIMFYILACVFSTLIGMAFGRVRAASGALYIVKYIEYFVVYFMVVNNLRDMAQVKRFTAAFLVTGAIVCLYGIFTIGTTARVSAPFEPGGGSPNTYGIYLVFLMSITMGLFLTAASTRNKLLLGGLALLIIPPLLFAKSRGAWIAAGPMFLTFVVLSEKRKWLLAALLVGVLLGPHVVPKEIISRYKETFMKSTISVKVAGVDVGYSASARISSWKSVLKNLPKHPILGYGVTGYHFIDGMFFRTLIELGLLGFSAFIWMLYSVFKWTLKVYREIDDIYSKGLVMGFIAGFVALLTNAVPLNTFIIIRVMMPFWFFAGIVVMLPAITKRELQE